MTNSKDIYIEARRLPEPDKELWDYFSQIIGVALEGVEIVNDRLHGPVERRTWTTDSEHVLLDRQFTDDPNEPRKVWLSATPISEDQGNAVEFFEDNEFVTKATGPAVDSRTTTPHQQESWIKSHLESIFREYPEVLTTLIEQVDGPAEAGLEENPRIDGE